MVAPVKYEYLSKDVVKRLTEIYKGSFEKLCRVGPAGYLLPADFRPHIDPVRSLSVRHDDVWVSTFPRSGTHLTLEMIWLLQNNLDYKTAAEVKLWERNTFIGPYLLDCRKTPAYFPPDSYPAPRLVSSHLPLSLLPPILDAARVVFVARDPRDVAVSYFHFHKHMQNYGRFESFKQFWKLFVEDLIVCTPFFPMIKEAWAQRNHPNMLFMFYEDIIKDMSSAVRRMASFIGRQYSEEQFTRLCEHLRVDNMKSNKSLMFMEGVVVVRTGKAGGWREYFDQELADQAERWMRQQLQGTDLVFPSP